MKYIIEIKPEYEANGIMILGARDSHLYVTTLEVKDLEELNSDYINEHFGDLQDTAYQKGFEDGQAVNDKGCEGCKYAGKVRTGLPCIACCNSYKNQWQAKQTDDKSIDIIRNGIHNWVTELNVKLDDIASILEDMRHD